MTSVIGCNSNWAQCDAYQGEMLWFETAADAMAAACTMAVLASVQVDLKYEGSNVHSLKLLKLHSFGQAIMYHATHSICRLHSCSTCFIPALYRPAAVRAWHHASHICNHKHRRLTWHPREVIGSLCEGAVPRLKVQARRPDKGNTEVGHEESPMVLIILVRE